MEQEQAKQQAQQQALRERGAHLGAVYAQKAAYWQSIHADVERASGHSYNKAAADLYELCEAYETNGQLAEFVVLYAAFLELVKNKKALMKRLERLNNYLSTLQ